MMNDIEFFSVKYVGFFFFFEKKYTGY